MATRTKVAVVQMTSTPDVAQNLDAAERLVRAAKAEGAELVVLPEGFAYLGPDEDPKKDGVPEVLGDGPIFARMAGLARELGVELVLGGFPERSPVPGKAFNACVHVGRDGVVRATYRKIHLFDVDLPDGTKLEESRNTEPGAEVVATEAPFGTLGLSVCYDLRFPELYRKLVDRGAIALTVPSAFTLTTGKDHWHVLLRARAIESQSYVLAAAQFGKHFGSRVSYGHALVIDPWGTVLAECGDGEGVATAWVDPAVVARIRASLPSLRHRRVG